MAFIIKPLVTEKMSTIMDKQNKYGFIVRPDANKLCAGILQCLYAFCQLSAAIHKFFGCVSQIFQRFFQIIPAFDIIDS